MEQELLDLFVQFCQDGAVELELLDLFSYNSAGKGQWSWSYSIYSVQFCREGAVELELLDLFVQFCREGQWSGILVTRNNCV